MIYGIILAAGSGSRMKIKDKKQFIKINNKPVLFYSIDKFLKVSLIVLFFRYRFYQLLNISYFFQK